MNYRFILESFLKYILLFVVSSIWEFAMTMLLTKGDIQASFLIGLVVANFMAIWLFFTFEIIRRKK